ncbi:MAG: hypothetical protein DCC71_14830 [Proteobacteria bacterium]|nr:MAG: hypothetical protein DCC71_14830 [Pseudomonadota bacterium]
MSARSNRRAWLSGAASAAMLLAASAASAQPAASSAAANAARDPRAAAVVERMAETLVAAQALRVEGDIAWDVVQADGQTLEFGATRELVLRRPDRLRADLVLREGGERRLFYDGRQVVLHDPVHGVYAAIERSGPVGEVAAFVAERLGIPIALAELLSPDLAALLSEKIDAAHYVATETLDGVACDHVALRGAAGGMQLWVGTKDALPRRISITYEHEEGRPQFRARFADWDLSPRVPDATFVFDPPAGAEKIAFAVHGAPAPKEGPR